jgi:5-methylcytosine-specific restriction endonuclease McrA
MSAAVAQAIRGMMDAGFTLEHALLAIECFDQAHQDNRLGSGPRQVPTALRAFILDRDGHRCTYCGGEGVPLQCDHVVPYSRGGATEAENLVAACKPCNVRKKNRTPEEWMR